MHTNHLFEMKKADLRSVSKNALVLMCGPMKLGLKKERKMRQESILWENIEHEYAIWHFIRYKKIADIINETEGKQLLDVGCGIGLLDLLITNKEIIGMDINRKNVIEAIQIRKNNKLRENAFHALVADLHTLPFKEKFDVVICSEVLEHLTDDRRALKALLSVLKQKGLLLITLPNALRLAFPQLSRLALRPKYLCSEHLREYKVNTVHNLVRPFQLRIEKITGIYFDFPLFHIFSLPTRAFTSIQFSTKFRFFVYTTLYRIYATFWTTLEKLFWHHAYHILLVLRKATSSKDRHSHCF